MSTVRPVWEYAVLTVTLVSVVEDQWTYQALAWVDEAEIYSRTLESMYWSAPLADMGRDGWELVGTTTENALAPTWVEGWPGDASRPVRATFFFKRAAASA
jgi:hypothetical protein